MFGHTCDNVAAFRVVTPSGAVVFAD